MFIGSILAGLAVSTTIGLHVTAFTVGPNLHARTSFTNLARKASTTKDDTVDAVGKAIIAVALTLAVFNPSPAFADGQTTKFKLPPVDTSIKNRCRFSDSKMGQANAARDSLYDLRFCDMSGKDASGYDLSGVIMTGTDVSKAKFVESQFSKGYLHDSKFDGADFTNSIVDRASFKGSSLKGAIFRNSVLSGTSFEDADLENADFTDSYLGLFDQKNLCKNPTLSGENPTTGVESRFSAGCL